MAAKATAAATGAAAAAAAKGKYCCGCGISEAKVFELLFRNQFYIQIEKKSKERMDKEILGGPIRGKRKIKTERRRKERKEEREK